MKTKFYSIFVWEVALPMTGTEWKWSLQLYLYLHSLERDALELGLSRLAGLL